MNYNDQVNEAVKSIRKSMPAKFKVSPLTLSTFADASEHLLAVSPLLRKFSSLLARDMPACAASAPGKPCDACLTNDAMEMAVASTIASYVSLAQHIKMLNMLLLDAPADNTPKVAHEDFIAELSRLFREAAEAAEEEAS